MTAEPDHGSEGNEGKETDEQPGSPNPIAAARSIKLAFTAERPKYRLILYAATTYSQDELTSFLV